MSWWWSRHKYKNAMATIRLKTKCLKRDKHNIVNKTECRCFPWRSPLRGRISALCLQAWSAHPPCGTPYNHQTFTQLRAHRTNLIIHTFESHSTKSSNKNGQICFQTITDAACVPRCERSPAESEEGRPFSITQVASKQQTGSLNISPDSAIGFYLTNTGSRISLKKTSVRSLFWKEKGCSSGLDYGNTQGGRVTQPCSI